MAPRSIPAHFDGMHIRLDQSVELKADAKLLVIVLPEHDEERQDWIRASQASLARAYGENEPEYALDMINEPSKYLDAAYQEMATDAGREREAQEWLEGTAGDVGDEPW